MNSLFAFLVSFDGALFLVFVVWLAHRIGFVSEAVDRVLRGSPYRANQPKEGR